MIKPDPYRLVSVEENRWLAMGIAVVILLTSLPYLACLLAAGPEMIPTGVLVNPSDGMSYLAKMQMGWQGKWIFHLPYTAEEGPGAWLFLYYIGLGHLAKLLSLPIPFAVHIARVFGVGMMLLVTYRLIAHISDDIRLRRLMWWLVALSSGLGWIVQKFGLGYSYYEAQIILYSNTFYCLLANAHFPIALALMLAILLQGIQAHPLRTSKIAQAIVTTWILAIILPFSVVASYLILGASLLLIWARDKSFPRSQFILSFIAGGASVPILLYMQMATQADPTLKEWSLHNLTPSPSLVGLFIAYGLLFIFAVPGIKQAWERKSDWDILLATWVIAILILMYLPFSLQYRFSLGLHIPMAILAAMGIERTLSNKLTRTLALAIMGSTTLYLTVNLLGRTPANVAINNYPLMYLSKDEAAAFDWLRNNVASNKTVLGAPESGVLIPAYAGQRVVYGHIIETVDAARKIGLVKDFFANKINQQNVLQEFAIDYVLIGKRENALGKVDTTNLPLKQVFESGNTHIYNVQRELP
jgi:hypothetical protein